MNRLLHYLPHVLLLCLVYYNYVVLKDEFFERKLSNEGLLHEAVVISKSSYAHRAITKYHLELRYTVDERKCRGSIRVDHLIYQRHAEGDKIDILIHPENPTTFIIPANEGKDMRLTGLIIMDVFAAVCLFFWFR